MVLFVWSVVSCIIICTALALLSRSRNSRSMDEIAFELEIGAANRLIQPREGRRERPCSLGPSSLG